MTCCTQPTIAGLLARCKSFQDRGKQPGRPELEVHAVGAADPEVGQTHEALDHIIPILHLAALAEHAHEVVGPVALDARVVGNTVSR